MIPTILQDKLVQECKILFNNYRQDSEGNIIELNIYSQNLPEKKYQQDDNYPYLLIRLQDGEENGPEEPNTCTIVFIVACKDQNNDYQGYKDVINIIDKIYHRLMTQRVLDKTFEIEYPISWNLQEEDSYPFYFGGLLTNWNCHKVTREEESYL